MNFFSIFIKGSPLVDILFDFNCLLENSHETFNRGNNGGVIKQNETTRVVIDVMS